MEEAKRKRARRRHSAELKARVLSECAQPGASVAAIAQSHGLNANLVHRWLRLARPAAVSGGPTVRSSTDGFVALTLAQQPAQAALRDIRVDLRRGAVFVNIHWPVQGGGDCVAWLRELLR